MKMLHSLNATTTAYVGAVLVASVLPACAHPQESHPEGVGSVQQPAIQEDETFDWGGECSTGAGDFTSRIHFRDTTVIGEIPPTKRDVRIDLASARDVDVQLVDTLTGTEIIAWPGGLLNGPGEECTHYSGVQYCYSGYNGVNGEFGAEWIEVRGDTNRDLEMRAYGYQAGDAVVEYAWNAVNTCSETGEGAFSQYIATNSVTDVGEIPEGKVNVVIELRADGGRDVDVQLFAGDVPLVMWPSGRLNGPTEDTLQYEGMEIVYSGYNGINGNWGHERIEINGRVSETLMMKAFGYQSGTAQIEYEWGDGAGDACGSWGLEPCKDGLVCKNGDHGNIAVDKPGECHSQEWCESDTSAPGDCGKPPSSGPGYWSCVEFACQWNARGGEGEMCGGIAGFQCQDGLVCKGMDPDVADAAGTCREPNYCEVTSASADCRGQIHPMTPGEWGCEDNACLWVHHGGMKYANFHDLVDNGTPFADGSIVQVTWQANNQDADCAGNCEATPMVLGPVPTTPFPLGESNYAVLDGLSCTQQDCDVESGSWQRVWARASIYQGGHIRLKVVRAVPGTVCSQGDMACGLNQYCQIGIGCPTPDNCGFNPPGMCLENPLPAECVDLSNVNFGLCEMLLGWQFDGNACVPVSGCGDQGYDFFPSVSECNEACF